MAEREHDLVLFGATGFSGRLTAEHLAAHADEGTRWAIAGRSPEKLEQVRTKLTAINPACAELPVVQADSGDPASLHALAESSRVLITTVGPYILYGEPLVAACAATGTDYVDLTGEPEFVDQMWLRHQGEAERTGARLVHSCGFDSVPYELGAQFTVGHLPDDAPIRLEGFVRARVVPSGGTYHSAIHTMARLGEGARVAKERRRHEPSPAGRRVRGVFGAPRHDSFAGGWIVPVPTIDPQTVLRSARALPNYGPDFSYAHYLVVKRLPTLIGLGIGTAAAVALAQVPPARDALLKLKDPGEGPSPEQRAKSWFRIRFDGQSDGPRVMTEVTGEDPGYGGTAKMLAQSALCLAHDQLPQTAGQVTPAVAMGHALLERLQRVGVRFEVIKP